MSWFQNCPYMLHLVKNWMLKGRPKFLKRPSLLIMAVNYMLGLNWKWFYKDLDGGWSAWRDEQTGSGCAIEKRDCDNPSPCGLGLQCKGEGTVWNNCQEGKECFISPKYRSIIHYHFHQMKVFKTQHLTLLLLIFATYMKHKQIYIYIQSVQKVRSLK